MSFFENVRYIHFESIDSTNTWVKEHVEELDPIALTCVTADEQTKGKGRLGRSWVSPPNNLFASLFFIIEKNSSFLPNLGQVLALSATKALHSFRYEAQIKWPNDLLLDGKKVAGILVETIDQGDSYGVVLGIGVNIEIPEDVLKTIDQPAISLAQVRNPPSKEEIVQALIMQFIFELNRLFKVGFKPIKEEYESLLAFKDQKISYYDGEHLYRGTCLGVTDEGKLRLLLPSGEERQLVCGDIIY